MKRFMDTTVQLKFVWGLIFTATIILYSTIKMLMGETAITYILIWQIVAVTMALTFAYYFVFSDFIWSNSPTKYKVILNFIMSYIILFVSGILLNMLNISNVIHLVIFTCGFTLLYFQVIFAFYVYYKATGEELNKKLAVYKKNKKTD